MTEKRITNKDIVNKLDSLTDAIHQLVGVMTTKIKPEPEYEPEQTIKEDFTNPIKTKNMQLTTGNRPNYFEEIKHQFDESEKQELAEAREHDKKAIVRPPTPRRRSSGLVLVKCQVCGRQERVSPKLLLPKTKEDPDGGAGRWRCNDHIGG